MDSERIHAQLSDSTAPPGAVGCPETLDGLKQTLMDQAESIAQVRVEVCGLRARSASNLDQTFVPASWAAQCNIEVGYVTKKRATKPGIFAAIDIPRALQSSNVPEGRSSTMKTRKSRVVCLPRYFPGVTSGVDEILDRFATNPSRIQRGVISVQLYPITHVYDMHWFLDVFKQIMKGSLH